MYDKYSITKKKVSIQKTNNVNKIFKCVLKYLSLLKNKFIKKDEKD